MRAARLNHRVTLKEYVESQDPVTGALQKGWFIAKSLDGLELKDVPAEVLTGAGREPYLAGAYQSEITARVTLRWFAADPRVIQKWMIEHDIGHGVVNRYSIQSVESDPTGRVDWRLKCGDAEVSNER